MSILQTMKNNEYPDEYLIAKLRARLDEKIFNNIFSEKVLQIALLKEMQWLFYQMNSRLRKIFAEMFIYFEIKNIFSLLRFKYGGQTITEELLNTSLLSKDIKHFLMNSSDVASAIDGISEMFKREGLINLPLKGAYASGDLKSFEWSFVKSFLEVAVKTVEEDPTITFFNFKVDEINIISVYKALKWNTDKKPELIDGGEIKLVELRNILESKNMEALFTLSKTLTGLDLVSLHLEDALSKGLTKRLQRMARHVFGKIFICFYIWERQVEALERRKSIINRV